MDNHPDNVDEDRDFFMNIFDLDDHRSAEDIWASQHYTKEEDEGASDPEQQEVNPNRSGSGDENPERYEFSEREVGVGVNFDDLAELLRDPIDYEGVQVQNFLDFLEAEDDERLMETLLVCDQSSLGSSSQTQVKRKRKLTQEDEEEEAYGSSAQRYKLWDGDMSVGGVLQQQGGCSSHSDDKMRVSLNFGEMSQASQDSRVTFKFHGNEEVTFQMDSSDTLKKLGGEILRHLDGHLGLELPSGEEIILKSDGGTLSFRDCEFSKIENINVILRSPPVHNLADSVLGSREIDVIIDPRGPPMFKITVLLLDSVQDMKQKIEMITYIDKARQMLYFRKKVLEEDRRVAHCGLYNNCRIQLVNNIGDCLDPLSSAPISTTTATHKNEIIRVCLCYGDFNLPLPSATFEVKADSCLNVLKSEILKQVESYLVLKLPSAEVVRVGGSSYCDMSFADCHLSGSASIKLLLKQPPDCLGPYCGGAFSTRSWGMKELVIFQGGTSEGPSVRFKIRVSLQAKALQIKQAIEKISRGIISTRKQRLLNYASKEELRDNTMIDMICTEIELRIQTDRFGQSSSSMAASSHGKKRLTLKVRVNMPRLGIHNVDILMEVNASDKLILLKQKLRDIAKTKRLVLPLKESTYFFIHTRDGIDGCTHHIPLHNDQLSFEEAGVVGDDSTILAVSPCFAFLPHSLVNLFCQVCAHI